ncbi:MULTISPECIES: TetR/AcrR family transcriptional regulator [unclassified Streptomyces]|uniref:TetR/AcrR family transcriptional regulator n=1 Tax=unclassified Streptomyces TaxID=2593676 RepID=UPI00365EEA95
MAEEVPAYRRDRPRLPAAQRRRQIVEVTTRLIAERGFWGLSMQDVADGCGLTVQGLLHHVGSKDGLLVSVLEHAETEDALRLAAQLGTDDDDLTDSTEPRTVDLPQVCAAIVRRNTAQPEIVRLHAVLAAESLEPRHPAHAYFLARHQRAVSGLAELAEAVTDRPQSLARQILATMDGLELQWLRDPDGADLVREWEAASRVLFGQDR